MITQLIQKTVSTLMEDLRNQKINVAESEIMIMTIQRVTIETWRTLRQQSSVRGECLSYEQKHPIFKILFMLD